MGSSLNVTPCFLPFFTTHLGLFFFWLTFHDFFSCFLSVFSLFLPHCSFFFHLAFKASCLSFSNLRRRSNGVSFFSSAFYFSSSSLASNFHRGCLVVSALVFDCLTDLSTIGSECSPSDRSLEGLRDRLRLRDEVRFHNGVFQRCNVPWPLNLPNTFGCFALYCSL